MLRRAEAESDLELFDLAVPSYGACLVGWGGLSAGVLLAFYALLARLYGPIVRLAQFHGTAATLVAVDRIVEVLDEPDTVVKRPGALPARGQRTPALFGSRFRGRPAESGLTPSVAGWLTAAAVPRNRRAW